MADLNDKLKRFAELLSNAKNIACLTGAGMSTESGIPDYRSSSGLYNTMTSEEVFDIYAFRREPERFYKVIGPLYSAIVEAKPNSGHLGLHQKAGSRNVYEVHGTMSTLTCPKCGRTAMASGHLDEFRKGETLRCACGAVFKPDITFYGEMLPPDAFAGAAMAFVDCDLAIVLGTSLVVYPAASLPSQRRARTPLVIINKTATSMDGEATLVFNDSIGKILPAALELL